MMAPVRGTSVAGADACRAGAVEPAGGHESTHPEAETVRIRPEVGALADDDPLAAGHHLRAAKPAPRLVRWAGLPAFLLGYRGARRQRRWQRSYGSSSWVASGSTPGRA
jgi:hypothetical protein